jgi:hypothetical protein
MQFGWLIANENLCIANLIGVGAIGGSRATAPRGPQISAVDRKPGAGNEYPGPGGAAPHDPFRRELRWEPGTPDQSLQPQTKHEECQ